MFLIYAYMAFMQNYLGDFTVTCNFQVPKI